MGIGFLGIGFQPKWGLKDIPVMPKVSLLLLILDVVESSPVNFMVQINMLITYFMLLSLRN